MSEVPEYIKRNKILAGFVGTLLLLLLLVNSGLDAYQKVKAIFVPEIAGSNEGALALREKGSDMKDGVVSVKPTIEEDLGFVRDKDDYFLSLPEESEEDKRAAIGINPGVSMKYVEAMFGAPSAEKKLTKGRVMQLFAFKNYFLKVVYEKDKSVIYYAVTSRSKEFHPRLPYTRLRLGEFYFNKVSNGQTIESVDSAKFYRYSEYSYMAASGNYRNLYLEYNPAGVVYEDAAKYPVMDNQNREKIELFRKTAMPNTFGMGRSMGGEEEVESVREFGVGIDFYEDDLPLSPGPAGH